MAALANYTLKKNDGTTDILWTGIQPSSGDGTPAIWKSQTVGNAPAHQPEMRLFGREGNNGGSRVLRLTAFYPSLSTNSTTGLTTAYTRNRFVGEWTLDKNSPQTDIDEFVSQLAYMLNGTGFKAYIKSGYSAT